MGRKRSKSKSLGVRGPVEAGTQDDSISPKSPALGPVISGMQNASSTTEAPTWTEEKCVAAEDEQKTSVYREDSVLLEGDYRKAVKKVIESIEERAHVTGESGLAWSSMLRRLLLSRCNPPLQLWWAFTAAEKSVEMKSEAEPLSQLAAIIDFISKLLVSLRALSTRNVTGILAIAALAPVVALLHEAATLMHKSVGLSKAKDSDSDSVGGKKTRKLMRKLKELIRETLCLTVVCRRRDFPEFRHSSTLPSAEQSARLKLVETFYPPFPLASKHMNKALNKDPLNSAVIAEVVSVELAILQLIVETIDWRSTVRKQNKEHDVRHEEFAEKIKRLARISVYTGSTLSISEMLLDTLLEKRLPVGNLLDDTEEKLIRECIIEAVLMDPPYVGFLDKAGENGMDLPSILFIKRLAVGRRSIQTFRAQEDRKRADTLSRRIATWQTPPQLMKWLQAQKNHLLPLTALLGSQAFLSWVASTFDEVAFTSLLDRCVKTISSKSLPNNPTGETKDDDHDMEEEEEGDLFFVDTAGNGKDDRNVDAAVDLAFTKAAKDISKGKAERKREKMPEPIYNRLSQGGTRLGKQRGKKIIDELEDVKFDSDGEDSTMVEDDSSAEDSDLPQVSSSDHELSERVRVTKAEHSRKESDVEKHTEVSRGDSPGKVEEAVVAKPMTHPTKTEGDQVTTEKDVVMTEVLDVPSDAVVLSKGEVPRESKDSARETGVDPGRAVANKLVLAIQPNEKEDTEGMGDKDIEAKKVGFEPSGTDTKQGELLVEKKAEAADEGITKEGELEGETVLITSPTRKVDALEVAGEVQVMVEPSETATTDKPLSRKKIKSRRTSGLCDGEDQVTVESLQSSTTSGGKMEHGITNALASPDIASSSKTPQRSKRVRKAAADMDSESLEAITSAAALTKEKERDGDIQTLEIPSSALVTSSETSGKSKCGMETETPNVETVDVVTSALEVTTEKGVMVMKTPSSIPVTSSATSSKSKRGKETPAMDTETVDSMPSAAPVASEKNSDEQGAPPLSTLSDSVETSDKRATVEKDLQVVENAASSSPPILEKDSVTQNVNPGKASDETRGTSKRGNNSAVNIHRETEEDVQAPLPVMKEKSSGIQAALPRSPPTGAEDTQTKSKNSANQDSEAVENAVFTTLVTGDKGYGIEQVGSPSIPRTLDESPSTRKRGKKLKAIKYRNTAEGDSSEPPVQMERDHEIQKAPQSMFVDSVEITSRAEGDSRVGTPEKDTEVVADIPSSAVKKLLTAAIDVDQKPEEEAPLGALTSSEQTGTTQASAERDSEMTNVPSSSSPTSSKKRGRKPRPRNQDGSLMPPLPPTRRILTRGTTPQIAVEKEEEKVDEEDLGPIVLVTPHKAPRKGRKLVTVQEPQEKVNEVGPALDPALSSEVQMSHANLIAVVETGAVAPSTSVQDRGRKRTKTVSDDDLEDSSTPSGQATPSRSRKSTRARVVMDNEVNPTPTSSAQATPSKGRSSTRATKAVTDYETDDTQTTSVQATARRVRRSTRARVNTDDETDTTSTPPVQATGGRGKMVTEAKSVRDDVDFEEISSPRDQGTHSKGRKNSKSRDIDGPDQVPPSATGSPRKKGLATSQPPGEDQEMNKQPEAVPVFTPRRSKRGTGSSQVKGESVDMALSPYKSSKKRKTKLPAIVDLTDDDE